MEACILFVNTINTYVCVITSTSLYNCVDSLSNCTVQANSFLKVITISCKILSPDDNGIVRLCIWDPACIYSHLVGQCLVEVILCTARCLIGRRFVCKPSSECITIADHGAVSRSGRFVTGVNELWSVVGSALSVFIKDEPMTCWCVDTESDIACNGDVSHILIFRAFFVSNDIATAFYNIPTFKVMCIILNGIPHIDRIRLSCTGCIGTESHLFLSERDVFLIQICDAVVFEQHRIVSNSLFI